MTVIDVHTHMLSRAYLDRIKQHGGPKYNVDKSDTGQEYIYLNGVPFSTLLPEMWDYPARIRDMDKAGVDLAIVSLTSPSVYWGTEEVSKNTAIMMNDDMAEQQSRWPDRIRWFASLPWQYSESATAELERSIQHGAVGVFVTANISGENLTDPKFASIWQAIDDKALPVLVHPTLPQGMEEMSLYEYGLAPSLGFTFDTSLAISRMILDGFLDRYPNLKIIAAHGGGALPYLVGRLDQCHSKIPAASAVIKEKPSEYLRRIYYDAVLYSPEALDLCIKVGGEDNVLYGSDYPHNIGDMAGCLGRTNALPGQQAAKVNSQNAQRIFNLS